MIEVGERMTAKFGLGWRGVAARRVGTAALLMSLAAAPIACGGSSSTEDPGGTGSSPSAEDGVLSVYVVNYPLMYFAERIGGAVVDVQFPAPAEGDPALWQPGAETIAAYQGADLIVRNGATYAKWMEMVSLPESKVVDTAAGFADQLIVVEGAVTHAHGPEGEHEHGDTAFTTWLDLSMARQQAEAVHAALVAERPGEAAAFDSNLEGLRADLSEIDAQLQAIGSSLPGVLLLASHPVYQYLARRYGLDIESVHFEPDGAPVEAAWTDLERIHAEHPARWMIWEGEPLADTAARLQAMGIESIVFDPCGNRPEGGDFISIMRANVANLEGIIAR